MQNSPHIASENIRFAADYRNPLSVMTRLTEVYTDTMLWGSDTPFYYWIQKFYTSEGELMEDNLQCGYKEEAQLLNNLPIEIRTKIAYKNSMRFIFGE